MNLVTNYNYNGTDSFNTVFENQPNNSIYLLCPYEGSKIFTDLGYTATGHGSAGITIMSVKWSSWRGFALSIPYIWDDTGGCYKFGRINSENSIIWRDVLDGEDLSDINSTISTLSNRSICTDTILDWVDRLNISCPAGETGIDVHSFMIPSNYRDRYGFIEISVQIKQVSQDTSFNLSLNNNNNTVISYNTSTLLAGRAGRFSLTSMIWIDNSTYKIHITSNKSSVVEAYLVRCFTFRPSLSAITP